MPGFRWARLLMTRCSFVFIFALIATALPSFAEPPQARMEEKHRALFKEYCVSCHGPDKQKGKFRADNLSFTLSNLETAEKWQKVLNQMNSGEMPPEDEKQLPNELKADFLAELSHTMVAARRALADTKGEITMRRMNRREYGNTLRALLGVEVDVSELPADGGTGNFDTVGLNLFMSGNQVEQYLEIGRDALDEAFEWRANENLEQKFHMEAEETLKVIQQYHTDSLDALERAKRWSKEVLEAAARPENAEVVARLRQKRKDDSFVRINWAQIKGAPSPELFGFGTRDNNAFTADRSLNYGTDVDIGIGRPAQEAYMKLPHLDTGAYLSIPGAARLPDTLNIMPKWKTFVGDYVFRFRIAATDKAPPERRFVEFGISLANGQIISTHQVTGTMAAPQIIEIPVSLTRHSAGRDEHTLFIREKATTDSNTQSRNKFTAAKKLNGIGPDFVLWVDWLELERIPNSRKGQAPAMDALGIPLDDKAKPSREEVRAALRRFCEAVFRGTEPQAGYLDRLTALYEAQLQAGDKHSAALKYTLAVVLSSPQFLYLAEPVDDGHRRRLSPSELATRLSYFLWSAPPDATLEELAKKGELNKPGVLAAQTSRLLDDARSRAFTRPFLQQWLQLDRLDFFQTNLDLYPRFDASTKLASRQEVYETFEYIMHHGASMHDLLKSNYVVVNPVLAYYYGLPAPAGDAFQKVSLPQGSPHGGLVGMAAIMAMGGNGDHTSPVERGAWVLRKLLNDPPPPAPANVPQITRLASKVLTPRERLQAHQENPQCASCHRKIDPIGFGLENFDAAGEWRTEDAYQAKDEHGRPVKGAAKTWTIDPSATLFKGPTFKDYFGLRDIIASRADSFSRGFSLALIEYALGRPIGFRDEGLADEMLAQAKKKDLTLREFIQALVASDEFHTK